MPNLKKSVIFNHKSYFRSFWKIPHLIWIRDYNESLEKFFQILYKSDSLVSEIEDEDKNDEEWWTDDFFEKTLNEKNEIIKIKSQIFAEYDNQLIKFYCDKYGIKLEEIEYISAKNSADVKHQQTIEAINNPKIRLIVKPYFNDKIETENDIIECVATFSFFDKKIKKITMSKYSSKIQMEHSFYAVYFYDLLTSLGIKVNDISIIGLSPFLDEIPKKGVLKFFESFNSRLVKSFKIPKQDKSDRLLCNLYNTGEILTNTKYIQSPITFMTYCKLRCFNLDYKPFNAKQEGDEILNISWPPFCDTTSEKNSNNLFELENYKVVVEKNKSFIRRNIDENLALELKKYIHENLLVYDNVNLNKKGHCFEFCFSGSIIETKTKNLLIMLYNGNIYNDVSNNYYNHNNSEIDKKKFYLVKNSYIANADFIEHKNNILREENNYIDFGCLNVIKNIHVKNSRTVWYDYEGFSSPLPIMDYFNSYNQVVNQVSVIVTKNGKTESIENVVVDPLKEMNMINLVKMLYIIYSDKADNYVVYNRGYENSRNSEILKVSYSIFEKKQKNPNDLTNDEKEFVEFLNNNGGLDQLNFIVNWIINNTIDLADCFRVSNTLIDLKHNNISYFCFDGNNLIKTKDKSKTQILFNQFIYIKDLKYRYSIKRIEGLISSKNINLKTTIKPYSELSIQKGAMAMTEAIARYAGITGDNVWSIKVEELKEYCQNDVEAMIMVYEFIMYLVRIYFPKIDDFEYQLNEKQKYSVREQIFLIDEK